MFQATVVQKVKTHFVFNFLIIENHAVSDTVWKSIV